MSRHLNQPDEQDPEVPEPLGAALRNLYAAPPVPAAMDAEILREARAGFARRRRFRLAFAGAAAAAAAGIALAFLIPALMETGTGTGRGVSSSQMLMVAPAADEDIDRDGKVDILDAFVVARLIQVRGDIDRSYDVNGDGAVDQSDVDRIAAVAVNTSDTLPAIREAGPQ